MKNRELELEEELNRMKSILDMLPFEVWYKTLEGKYLYVNKCFEEYSGKTTAEILGKDDFQVFQEEEAKAYVISDKELLSGKIQEIFEMDLPNGKCKEKLKKIIRGENGKPLAMAGFSKDITEKEKTLGALKKSEERFRTIFEKSQIGIGIFDSKTGVAHHVNKRLAEILGRTEEELLKLKWQDYSHPEDVTKNLEQIAMMNCNEIENFSLDKRFVKSDGTVIWANIIATPFQAQDEKYDSCHMCMINDISAQKRAEDESFYLNYHDQLTGLYNRRYYEEALASLDTNDKLPLSLIMADVNGLKLTNDAFGHMEGDQLLQQVGEVLKNECRDTDIISRMGGDEFTILLPNTSSAEAGMILNRINATIKNEAWENLVCSVSFGLATKTDISDDIRKIFMLAEDNMYRNKLTESRSMRYETIRVIRETLYQKNKREQYHCERVSKLCESMGSAIGLSSAEIIELKTAGLLHDIGKIGIDENLLDKPGTLTSFEWEDMERHPEIGYHILGSVNEFAFIAEFVLCHHERIDGSGYPRKLKAEQIPLQAKIINIADSYDAMTSSRAYKNSMTKPEAINEILKNAGTQFDEELAKIFVEKVLNAG